MTDPRLNAGHALVVGASSDIGQAIAVDLAQLGYQLTLWGRDRTKLAVAMHACRRFQPSVDMAQVDVTNRAQLISALHDVTTRAPLTAVVWAAGLFDWGAADTADIDTWDRLLDVNLASAAALTRWSCPR